MARAGLALAGTALGLAATVVIADRVVAHRGMDAAMIGKVLYYQNADVPVHRISDDAVLHYELAPGGTIQATGQFGPYASSIGPHAARSHHELAKPDGTFRIAMFGGSTVYGHHVSDDATIPARLEHYLGPDVEVWNFGTSAYVQTQMMRRARNALRDVPDIDLVVIMITNAGRRAFLQTDDPADIARYLEMLDEDPYGWLENFPTPTLSGLSTDQATRLHYGLMKSSAIWRYLRAVELGQTRQEVRNSYTNAQAAEERTALLSEAAERGVPVVFAQYPGNANNPIGAPQGVDASQVVQLWLPDQPRGFYEIHPPPGFLDGHAERLAQLLVEAGHVPQAAEN